MRSAQTVFVLFTTLAIIAGTEPSFAQHSEPFSVTYGHAARSKTGDPRTGFQRYAIPSRYSIEYPEGWFVESVPESETGYITIWNQRPSELGGGSFPAGLVKTDVSISPIPFEESVQAALDSEGDLDMGTITRKGELTVGGRDAYRIWTIEGASNSDSITTLVRYSTTETATISSFFTSGETWAIPTMKDIHWSFRRLLD